LTLITINLFFTASGGNPFHNVEKTAVLQEARIFNETPVKARRCTHVLTKILYLINQVRMQFSLNMKSLFSKHLIFTG
jgi:hypothetical protein